MPKTCAHPECNYPAWGGGFCKSPWHQILRTDAAYLRSKEKKQNSQKKFTPIAKVSAKKLTENDGNIWQAGKIKPVSKSQAKKDAIYFSLLPDWKLENDTCCFPGCEAPTDHCHHARGRGKYYLIISTWRPLCEPHHVWAELHPVEAKKLKLSESRLAKYDDENN